MALDARKRQKKAEKRNAKQKAKHKELARRKAEGLGERLARAASAPILHCLTNQSLWDSGIAQVLVSRELTMGQVAFAAFLVDRYCLGVKNVLCGFAPRSEYMEKLYEKIKATDDVVSLKPAAARKLVEGSVEYARRFGLSPHGDFQKARQIFGDIDPAQSDRTFEFGKDGKPFFVSGPNDSPARCKAIVSTLNQSCGPGGFDYLVHVPGGMLDEAGMLHLARAFDSEEDSDWEDGELAEEDLGDMDSQGDVIDGTVNG